MSDKHTPGPWGVEQTGDTNWIGPLRGNGKVAEIVCSTDREGLKRSALERNDANAHLIAAAPDMLDTLRAAREFITNGIEFGYINMPDTALGDTATRLPGLVRAAINKAEGRK